MYWILTLWSMLWFHWTSVRKFLLRHHSFINAILLSHLSFINASSTTFFHYSICWKCAPVQIVWYVTCYVLLEPLFIEMVYVTALSAIKTALDQVVTDQTALTSAANALDSALKTLKSDIDSTKSGCNGQCSPNTVCDAIDTSVLAVSIDFSAVRSVCYT